MTRASLSFILLDLKLVELIVTVSGAQFLLLWQDQISSLDILACVGSRKLLHETVASAVHRDISFLSLVLKPFSLVNRIVLNIFFKNDGPLLVAKVVKIRHMTARTKVCSCTSWKKFLHVSLFSTVAAAGARSSWLLAPQNAHHQQWLETYDSESSGYHNILLKLSWVIKVYINCAFSVDWHHNLDPHISTPVVTLVSIFCSASISVSEWWEVRSLGRQQQGSIN